MNKTLVLAVALAALANAAAVGAQQGEVVSLRGKAAVDADPQTPEMIKWQPDRDPIARDYVQQPPLIPHSIDGYRIDLKSNKCLTCHSWANYKEARATKVSQTHFQDRDRAVRANIAGTRYFCTQCHVSQKLAKPLVDNTFEPIEAVRQR